MFFIIPLSQEGDEHIMKSGMVFIIGLMILASFSSCKNNNTNNTPSQSSSTVELNQSSPDVIIPPADYPDYGFLGEVEVIIKDLYQCKDYTDRDAVYITLDFTNHSQETTSFMSSVQVYAVQNDQILTPATIHNVSGYDIKKQTKYISSEETIEVQIAFQLNDNESPVTVFASEFMSENGPQIAKTFVL